MFIKRLLDSNRTLLEYSYELLATGRIQPDTYVIDVDTVLQNATVIKTQADKYNIKLYYMTKQLGRNPYIARKLDEAGYSGAVAVDWREALVLKNAGAKLGHIGHLVQIPRCVLPELLAACPEVLTVYSVEQALQVNAAAAQLGVRQKVLLKVCDSGDIVYPGQEGGIPLGLLTEAALTIGALGNLEVEGVTAFPCFLYNNDEQKITATPNMTTLQAATAILRHNGINIKQINTPSATCAATIPLLAENGSTHGEPGHALTGTTPLHAGTAQPEKVAILYASEVSHNVFSKALCYGGGYYRRGHMKNAVVKTASGWRAVATGTVADDAIDYYLPLAERLDTGTPVLFCFRTQVFVTRSRIALVEGLPSGRLAMIASFDAQGREC